MAVPHGSNGGFRPQELDKRRFQAAVSRTFDVQAHAIGEQQEKLRVTSEFMADLSQRVDAHASDIAALVRRIAQLEERAQRSLWQRLRQWFF